MTISVQQPQTQIDTVLLRQQEYLQAFTARYTQRTKTSKQIAQSSRSVLADPRNSSGFSLFLKEMFYPIVGKRSLGSRIWDVDGNEYIDLLMGFGVNLFGHNPPFVKAALEAQLDQGIQIGPNAELAGVVAQLICELTGMERVTFSNTGTEAVMTALRLARKATGRNKIALFSNSYHGHFDGTLARAAGDNPQGVPSDLGVIPNFVADVLVLDYGNFQSLEIIKAHKHELAAVLVEPVQTRRPDLQPFEFLKQLRDLTKESAIALIFDEMVTGFRVHPGGAQAVFGIEADIATYGKVVGGGMPIGIVAGKPAYMDGIDGGMWNYGDDSSPQTKTTFFAGTYCKHPLSMAAARAVLLHLKSQGPKLQEQLNQRTSDFVARLNAFFQSAHLPMQFANFGSYFGSVPFGNSAQTGSSAVSDSLNFLNYHLLDKGIFIRGGDGFISTAHTDEDINYILQSVQDSVEDLRRGCFL